MATFSDDAAATAGGEPGAPPDEQEPAEPAPRKRDPWSSADRRLLLITFGGGLAANLATVIVVGLAILVVHQQQSSHSGLTRLETFVFDAWAGAVCLAAAVTGAHIRRTKPDSFEGRVFLIGGSLVVLVIVLTWIGLAAGIK